jgi:hypothetical protein
MDEPPSVSSLGSRAEAKPSSDRRSRGRLWVRLLLTLAVIAAPLIYVLSQQSPDLPSRIGDHLFPPVLTPTATTPPLLIAILRKRPLTLPTLPAGSPCPAPPPHTVDADFTVNGDGPVYLLNSEEILLYTPAQSPGSQGWGAQELLFLISPGVNGVVLVRGRQLDGPNEVRFGKGDAPDTELVFRAPAEAHPGDLSNPWTIAFEIIRLRAAGCYAIQADSETASSVIIFRAEPQQA